MKLSILLLVLVLVIIPNSESWRRRRFRFRFRARFRVRRFIRLPRIRVKRIVRRVGRFIKRVARPITSVIDKVKNRVKHVYQKVKAAAKNIAQTLIQPLLGNKCRQPIRDVIIALITNQEKLNLAKEFLKEMSWSQQQVIHTKVIPRLEKIIRALNEDLEKACHKPSDPTNGEIVTVEGELKAFNADLAEMIQKKFNLPVTPEEAQNCGLDRMGSGKRSDDMASDLQLREINREDDSMLLTDDDVVMDPQLRDADTANDIMPLADDDDEMLEILARYSRDVEGLTEKYEGLRTVKNYNKDETLAILMQSMCSDSEALAGIFKRGEESEEALVSSAA